MKTNLLSNLKFILVCSFIAFTTISCEKDEDMDGDSFENRSRSDFYFNVVISTSTEGNTETYVQSLQDSVISAKDYNINFSGFGFEVPSTRTARVYASDNGTILYNLNYGGGTIYKYNVYDGGEYYKEVAETGVTQKVGTEYPRWTKINDATALIHNVKTANVYDFTNGADTIEAYKHTSAKASLVDVNLANLSLGADITFEIPRNNEDISNNLYISRIDAPAISGGKAYYGVTKAKRDPENPTENLSSSKITYKSASLVVDYPSLKNPKIITSELGSGANYGYRIPVAHTDEKGDIYQMTSFNSKILKISDGEYENTYDFDLATALGMTTEGVGARGWFYAGNGIGYVPFYDMSKGSNDKAKAWGIARVDLNTKTAIKMNVIGDLYLFQYQFAKVVDGKVYMALAPVGTDGNIYVFDSRVANANGFEIGAKLKSGVGISYIGVF